MNELALFAGAGGGILGGHLLGWRTVCAVEWEPYPAGVLIARQNEGILPPFPIWDDVRTFDGNPWRGRVDVVSGGFPCQDISAAGKGKGIDGERSGMWKEMARIIGEVQPRFAFVENSPMLTSRGLDRVLGDLSTLGYNAEFGVVGADDAGAPHRRERIWILAYATVPNDATCGNTGGRQPRKLGGSGCGENGSQHPIGQLADPDVFGRLHGQAEERTAIGGIHAQREPEPSGEDVADANGPGIPIHGRIREQGLGSGGSEAALGERSAGAEWWATEPGLGVLVDRLAAGMGPHGPVEPGSVPRVATGIPRRADRLKAIGNGQVPAAAALAWNTLYSRIQK